MSALAPPILWRFTHLSFPFPSPSDTCHAGKKSQQVFFADITTPDEPQTSLSLGILENWVERDTLFNLL